MKNDETRSFFTDELRVIDGAEGQLPKITGYAAVFNSVSEDLGGFREQIHKGAFSDALAPAREVLAMLEHDPSKTIGRRSRGTLNLREDHRGLYVEITPPNTTLGKDTVEAVKRGDLSGMSFRFAPGTKDAWSRDGAGNRVRSISKFSILREVTLTAVPCYPETTVEVRNLIAQMEADEKKTPLRDAATRRLRLAGK